MLCSSSSSSFSSDDGSESNSDRSSVILGDGEASFVFRAACNSEEPFEANMALEAERELEFQRRFTGEVDVGTW